MKKAASKTPASTPDYQAMPLAVLLMHAHKGDRTAQFYAGVQAIMSGKPQEAIEWYTKSALQGDKDAQYNLGEIYFTGKGVPVNYTEAFRWTKMAADQEDAISQRTVGYLYAQGWGVPKSYQEAYNWYLKAAKQGEAEAQSNLGQLLIEGWGVERDYVEAEKWLLKSLRQGYEGARNNLMVLYQRIIQQGGKPVERETIGFRLLQMGSLPTIEEMVVKLIESHKIGFPKGMSKYMDVNNPEIKNVINQTVELYIKIHFTTIPTGNLTSDQFRVLMETYAKDIAEASQSPHRHVVLLKKVAPQSTQATFLLGTIYHKGIGIAENRKEALEWYEAAAKKGHKDAQYYTGFFYREGWGTEKKDFVKAAEWFKQAAEQGHAGAQHNLGYFYAKGVEGISKDFKAAEEWLGRAAKQGNQQAVALLEKVQQELKETPAAAVENEEERRPLSPERFAAKGKEERSSSPHRP